MNDLISLEEVNKWVDKLINELELIFADIREKNVDDSVCGLCEYDCDHGMDGFANECPGFEKDDCFKLKDSIKEEWTDIKNTPAVPAIPISVIEQIKAEIQEKEEGRWIIEREEETGKVMSFHCSKCYEKTGHFETIASNFCPECGAKMNLYPIEEWECIKDGETE